jgi:cold shock CspA family protein
VETSLRIEFQGMEPQEALRAEIAKHVGALEERFGRITSCRVMVKGPGNHHRTGGLYEINIRLGLPDGKEVNVGRTPSVDERHADIDFALADAFKRARRRLQDQARKIQGHVKTHEFPQPTGIVTKLEEDFGFLQDSDGREVYFHRNSVLEGAFARLQVGTRVSFVEEEGEKGAQASTVKLLGKHKLRP